MTTDVDAFPAGLDLDLAVALEVMGWGPLHRDRLDDGTRVRPEADRYPFLELRTWVGYTKVMECEPGLTIRLTEKQQLAWRPSTDLGCAWRIVQRCTLFDVRYEGEVDGWLSVKLAYRTDHFCSGEWSGFGGLEKLPLAVCRAALRAARS